MSTGQPSPHTISIVVPVYQGERTLPALLAELAPLTAPFHTPGGHAAVVTEVLLVWDNGPDQSERVIRDLAAAHEFVRPVWLSRNFGQHSATLAGMASSGGEWIVTMDEDGQHDPSAIGALLDTAMGERADIVYAEPANRVPHSLPRNLASRSAKRFLRLASGSKDITSFHSFRLMLGEVGRSVAAYAGADVYLDIALSWVARSVATSRITMRQEMDRPSGYNWPSLFSHFWRMVLTSGTRALRLVSILGVLLAACGVALAITVVVVQLIWGFDARGWSSLMSATLLIGGAILFSLGVIAEYLGVAVNASMGRPPYLIISDRAHGPHGRIAPPGRTDDGRPGVRTEG